MSERRLFLVPKTTTIDDILNKGSYVDKFGLESHHWNICKVYHPMHIIIEVIGSLPTQLDVLRKWFLYYGDEVREWIDDDGYFNMECTGKDGFQYYLSYY